MKRRPKTGKAKARVTVTKRAILARINRALKKDGEVVKKSRQANAPGDYFKVLRSGSAVQYVELKGVAEDLGALKAWEVLEK